MRIYDGEWIERDGCLFRDPAKVTRDQAVHAADVRDHRIAREAIDAITEYDAALANREHGGVAADRALTRIRAAMEGHQCATASAQD